MVVNVVLVNRFVFVRVFDVAVFALVSKFTRVFLIPNKTEYCCFAVQLKGESKRNNE